jgi:sugar phosphate isomerase/epimerase
MSGLGVCIELFHCWAEGDLDAMVQRALPRTELIQLSDYVLGDRALPGRAVPGDGAIPIETFVAQALAGGYSHGFDLELIGPRIDEEGRLESARRACDVVGAMLDRLGA